MRYLLPLFFSPFAAFAGCAPGVNYGSAHIVSSNPICYVYSGSTLGGCYAYCGGSDNGSVCVELPNAVPPTRGPYFSSGQECTPNNNNGPGKDPNPPVGEDGTATGGNGVVNMGVLWVGQNSHADLGKGFNVVSNNVRVASEKVSGEIKDFSRKFDSFSFDASKYLSESSQDLKRIGNYTSGITGSIYQTGDTTNFHLTTLNNKQVLSSDYWDAKERRLIGQLENMGSPDYSFDLAQIQNHLNSLINANLRVVSNTDGLWGKLHQIGQNTEMSAAQAGNMVSALESIEELLRNGQGGGEGGDKPCEGPLCSFNKPSGSSGSALSKVFSTESIDDVKKQIENKDTEISDAMNDVKSVFAPEELTITGTYNNDYHDINGVRVDLSGKSNLELFFNSGPKMAIWFLAVLLAFSILMGGRKNA